MAKDDIGKCSKAYRESAAFKRASFHPPDEIWNIFADADHLRDIFDYFKALVNSLNIDENLYGLEFYEVLKSKLTSWKCQSLWDLLNLRLKNAAYKHEKEPAAKALKCIVIGAGPIGLRTAIELSLLGSRAIIVERRKDFTRNNVLHLWSFLLTDFKGLGAKKFYGKFASGCIDHINIKTLQAILLKVALVVGVDFHYGVEFKNLVEPTDNHGWRAEFVPGNLEVSKLDFDVVIGADGKKNVLPGFTQVELRGSLALGITCNFINNNTPEEASCNEISGISYQFKPTFFKDLKAQYGVELENIVYYKDETHYFVMTAVKSSLLSQGVFLKDINDPSMLVQSTNINKEKLKEYARNVVKFSTDLPKLDFKVLQNGQSDIALFDFTSLKKAENACRIYERKKHMMLVALVGDSLIEPFWPTGSGCGRGVLSALDVTWTVRQFALKYPPLAMIRERENVFKYLSASTNDNIQKNYDLFTIDPKTRYCSLDLRTIKDEQCMKCLYDTDDIDNANFTFDSPAAKPKYIATRKRKSIGSVKKVSSRTAAGKEKRKLERFDSKNVKNEERISFGDTKKFFEERNKNISSEVYVPKAKQAVLSEGELSGLDEDMELDDDVIVEEEEAVTIKKVVSQKHSSLKKQNSIFENSRGKLKRQFSKDPQRKQSSRATRIKSLKRQPSKSQDDLESSSHTKDNTPNTKRVFFQAKGGGLKSKSLKNELSLLEKSDDSKPKHKLENEKKSGSSIKRKAKKSEDSIVKEAVEPEKPRVKTDPKTFFNKWLDSLLPKLDKITKTESEPVEYEEVLSTCTQVAVLSVMAMGMLYNCNKTPTRRTTDLKLKELMVNAKNENDNFLKVSSNKEKHEEFNRAGSVRSFIANYNLLEKDKENAHPIVKRSNTEAVVEKDTVDGITLVDEGKEDFTAKDVIDVEQALLDDKEKEKKQSVITKIPRQSVADGTDGMSKLQSTFQQFCDLQTLTKALFMLQVLYNIHKRILDQPNIDKCYRIYTRGKIFEKYVWKLEGAEACLMDVGWVKCGEFLVVSKTHPVYSTVKVIEAVFRKNKRMLLYTGSYQSPSEELDDRNSYDTYTVIDVPLEGNPGIGNEMDRKEEVGIKLLSEKKKIIQPLHSKEHNIWDENYVVVDFINETTIHCDESAETETMEVTNTCNRDIFISTDDVVYPCKNSSPFTIVKAPEDTVIAHSRVASKPIKCEIENNEENKNTAITVSEDLLKPDLRNGDFLLNSDKEDVVTLEVTNGMHNDLIKPDSPNERSITHSLLNATTNNENVQHSIVMGIDQQITSELKRKYKNSVEKDRPQSESSFKHVKKDAFYMSRDSKFDITGIVTGERSLSEVSEDKISSNSNPRKEQTSSSRYINIPEFKISRDERENIENYEERGENIENTLALINPLEDLVTVEDKFKSSQGSKVTKVECSNNNPNINFVPPRSKSLERRNASKKKKRSPFKKIKNKCKDENRLLGNHTTVDVNTSMLIDKSYEERAIDVGPIYSLNNLSGTSENSEFVNTNQMTYTECEDINNEENYKAMPKNIVLCQSEQNATKYSKIEDRTKLSDVITTNSSEIIPKRNHNEHYDTIKNNIETDQSSLNRNARKRLVLKKRDGHKRNKHEFITGTSRDTIACGLDSMELSKHITNNVTSDILLSDNKNDLCDTPDGKKELITPVIFTQKRNYCMFDTLGSGDEKSVTPICYSENSNSWMFDKLNEYEEEIVTPVDVSENRSYSWVFDKLDELYARDNHQRIGEKTNIKSGEDVSKLSTTRPSKIDLSSNKNCVNNLEEEFANPKNVNAKHCIGVTLSDDNKSDKSESVNLNFQIDNISNEEFRLKESSDRESGVFSGDSISEDLHHEETYTEECINENKKKKRVFPFHLKVRKKRGKAKGGLRLTTGDASTVSSYKSLENVKSKDKKLSASSNDSKSSVSSSSSLSSSQYLPDGKFCRSNIGREGIREKVQNKKTEKDGNFPFFKKKKKTENNYTESYSVEDAPYRHCDETDTQSANAGVTKSDICSDHPSNEHGQIREVLI